MNYLFNLYMSKKTYFFKEPIFRLFKPPPSTANQSESKLINGVAGKTTGHVILI